MLNTLHDCPIRSSLQPHEVGDSLALMLRFRSLDYKFLKTTQHLQRFQSLMSHAHGQSLICDGLPSGVDH